MMFPCDPPTAKGRLHLERPILERTCRAKRSRGQSDGQSHWWVFGIATTREPLDQGVPVCASIEPLVASDSIFFGHDPEVDADPKPNADTVNGFFWCGARGLPTQAALHDELRAVGRWMCRPLRWVSRPRRNLAGAGPRLWTTTGVTSAPPPGPPNAMRKFCAHYFLFV